MVLAATLLFAVQVLSCKSMSQQTKSSISFEWDLSNRHSIQDVGWAAENTSDVYSLKGDILMKLKLSEGRSLNERLESFLCTRENEVLSNVNLHSHIMTLDEAHQNAKRLIEYWNLDPKDIEDWYKKQQSGRPENFGTFATFRNDLNPNIGIEILKSFNDAQPWYISFKISFVTSSSQNRFPHSTGKHRTRFMDGA